MSNNSKEGFILVNKPKGITSHDVVDIVRQRFKMRKIGHAGTLDPLAEGLLIILVGRYTKLFFRFANFDKEYIGMLKLGETTVSGDSQSEVIKRCDCTKIDDQLIKEAFSFFRGEIEQIPPMVSALRRNGKRLYNLARKGIIVERVPRKIKIHTLKILNIDFPYVKFRISCSKGTYVRKLAEDIGERIGCGAHMVKILRLSIGPFRLDEAIVLDAINESHLQKITF